MCQAKAKVKKKNLEKSPLVLRFDMSYEFNNSQFHVEVKKCFQIRSAVAESLEPDDLTEEINSIFTQVAQSHLAKRRKKRQV